MDPPPWLTAERVTMAAMIVAAVGAVPGCLATRDGPSDVAHLVGATVPSTIVLTWLLSRWAMRRENGLEIGRLVLFATALGAVNTGLSLLVLGVMRADPSLATMGLFWGSIIGWLHGAPCGFLYGVSFLVPYVTLHSQREASPAARVGRVLNVDGWWLVGIGGVTALLASPTDAWALGWAPLAFGLCVMVTGFALRLRQARFLRRVRRGLEPGWTLEPRDPEPRRFEPPTLADVDPARCDAVLRRVTPSRGPYRDSIDGVGRGPGREAKLVHTGRTAVDGQTRGEARMRVVMLALLSVLVVPLVGAGLIAASYEGYCYGFTDGRSPCSFSEYAGSQLAWLSALWFFFFIPHFAACWAVVFTFALLIVEGIRFCKGASALPLVPSHASLARDRPTLR